MFLNIRKLLNDVSKKLVYKKCVIGDVVYEIGDCGYSISRMLYFRMCDYR